MLREAKEKWVKLSVFKHGLWNLGASGLAYTVFWVDMVTTAGGTEDDHNGGGPKIQCDRWELALQWNYFYSAGLSGILDPH